MKSGAISPGGFEKFIQSCLSDCWSSSVIGGEGGGGGVLVMSRFAGSALRMFCGSLALSRVHRSEAVAR